MEAKGKYVLVDPTQNEIDYQQQHFIVFIKYNNDTEVHKSEVTNNYPMNDPALSLKGL